MSRVRTLINKVKKPVFVIITIILICIIAILDFITKSEYSFSLFYLIPVMFLAWYRDLFKSFIAALFTTLAWFFTDFIFIQEDISIIVVSWNILTRLTFYIIVIFLIHRIRDMHKKIENSASFDFLTGFYNLRTFTERVDNEIKRADRNKRAFSIAYIDIDNFKQVNDNFGHKSGNELLKYITNEIRTHIREIDIPGRVGGDEFIILFPETSELQAEKAMINIVNNLSNQTKFDLKGTTLSIGIICFYSTTISPESMMSLCDNLMYTAKKSGKNQIKIDVFVEEEYNGNEESFK